MKRTLSHDAVAAASREYSSGTRINDLAAPLGVTPHALRTRIRRAHGGRLPPQSPRPIDATGLRLAESYLLALRQVLTVSTPALSDPRLAGLDTALAAVRGAAEVSA
jgi:hypothetical protein